MIYFTSDYHFGHKNIAGPKVSRWDSGYRTFDSVEDMDDELLYQTNSLVKPNDVLYYLGDFTFDHKKIQHYRNKINCKTIHFIRGNHDPKQNHRLLDFHSIHDLLEVELNNHKFILCHYAMAIWNKSHRGSIHLYGHSHASAENKLDNLFPNRKSMDVGVDNAYRLLGEYRPFSIDEVIEFTDNGGCSIDHHA